MDPDFLQVKGAQIVNGRGEAVQLRGFCLGGWMNMENSITGYPSHETGQRQALEKVLGPERTRFFFNRFLEYFFGPKDLEWIGQLGCNVVRVALNYRHFESDSQPYEYIPQGFALLDQLIAWAAERKVYVILDLHSVQGWQNRGWHSDNPGREALFWGQKGFEDRAIALWQALAERYRDQAFVAGYNLMNEPDAREPALLNRFYSHLVAALRSVDPNHILFLDGNAYAREFSELDPPQDSNSVYSYHFYPEEILSKRVYPLKANGLSYDRSWLESIIASRSEYMRRYNLPAWAGEFGCLYWGDESDAYTLPLMNDLLDLFEDYGHHWTIWTYKDIGRLGAVYARPESEWMRLTLPVRTLKSRLRCDYWVERHESEIGRRLDELIQHVQGVVEGIPGDWDRLPDSLYGAVCEYALSQMLLPAYAAQFAGLEEEDIDRAMQSFALSNCMVRPGLTEIIQAHVPRAHVLRAHTPPAV